MNAIGWQIGAVLFGASFFLVAIYVAKILNTANKSVEKVNRLIDQNDRHITEMIDNAASITKSAKDIIQVVDKFASVFKVFKFFRR